jgi:hypothetical protein
MPSAEDAVQKIREKIAAGTLPRDAPGMTFAGFGTHQHCDGCDTPILPAEMEYEVPVRDGRTIRPHETFRHHPPAAAPRRGKSFHGLSPSVWRSYTPALVSFGQAHDRVGS